MWGDRPARRACVSVCVVASAFLGACVPAPPAPTQSPPTPALAATRAPAAAVATAPAEKPTAAPAAGPAEPRADAKPSEDWNGVVAAARREGKLVILGPAGNEVRDGLVEGFQKAFPEIQVDFSGMRGTEIPPKLFAELSAKQFVTDLVVGGTTSAVGDLIPGGALTPVRPYLAGPEARNESKWRGGKFDFADDAEQYNLVFANRLQTPFMYNPDLLDISEFRSWKDMLNPKWKGQMVMLDPRSPGGGLDRVTYWYTTEGLGKPYIQAFFAQDVTLLNDDRQILDSVARGKQAIGVGPSGVIAYEMRQKGLPIELASGEVLQEGTYLTASNASLGVVVNAPHPNAVKVFLNYLLSRDAQTDYTRATGLTSLRSDVPREHLLDLIMPKDGVTYQLNYKERYVKLRDEVRAYLRTVIPG